MVALDEQETTVSGYRNDGVVHVYTSNLVHLRRLRKDARVAELAGGDDWGRFTIPSDLFDPLKGFKRAGRKLTDEQRAAAGERLRAARKGE